jgi:hypothetical protein
VLTSEQVPATVAVNVAEHRSDDLVGQFQHPATTRMATGSAQRSPGAAVSQANAPKENHCTRCDVRSHTHHLNFSPPDAEATSGRAPESLESQKQIMPAVGCSGRKGPQEELKSLLRLPVHRGL